ncbi:MAG: hypothetical protein H7Z74_18965 [Anaerolineae bacterium]|nr:hypothetical protein [Gemmatimonadaceae bacterium]
MNIEPTAFRAEQVTSEGYAQRAGAPYSGLACNEQRDAWKEDAKRMSSPRYERFSDSIETLLNDTLACDGAGLELLLALQSQVSALNGVWEAHQRGVAVLPESIVHSISVARTQIPSFLVGVRAESAFNGR